MRSAVRILAGLIAAGLLMACQTLAVRPEGPPPDAEALQRLWRAQAERIQRVRLDAAAEFSTDKERQRGTLLATLEKPRRAAFEATGPAGLMAVAVLDGERYSLYEVREGRVLTGPSGASAPRGRLPLLLPPETLVPLLCATPRPIAGRARGPVFDPEARRYKLTLAADGGGAAQEFWFDPAGQIVRVRLLGAAGGVIYEAVYLGWEERGAGRIPFPGVIRLAVPAERAELALTLRTEPEINGPPDEAVFHPDFPAALPRVEAGNPSP